jgi:hypothetical protein
VGLIYTVMKAVGVGVDVGPAALSEVFCLRATVPSQENSICTCSKVLNHMFPLKLLNGEPGR